MRSTWILVGVISVAGVLAWINFSSDDDEPADPPSAGAPKEAQHSASPKTPSLKREATKRAPVAAPAPTEKAASEIVRGISKAREAGDKSAIRRLESKLEKTAWETDAARRYAVARGRRLESAADGEVDRGRKIRAYDKARRLLSRGLFLPEMFNSDTTDTRARSELVSAIQALNKRVMTYAPGLPGVTARYRIEQGIRPVEIVARRSTVESGNTLTITRAATDKQLPMGPNAVMYWNQGNLQPKSMRAGASYVIPLEELSVHVHQKVYRAALYMGDWFVKEWRVGVGHPDSPTPVGEFKVDSKEENPDWWFNGRRIPFGHQENELGSRWIAIYGDEVPLSQGIGIHGTNKPRTVGTRCSNGCVRLNDRDVNELFWWIRTGYDDGPATRVFIHR